jgi:hypothetical protein
VVHGLVVGAYPARLGGEEETDWEEYQLGQPADALGEQQFRTTDLLDGVLADGGQLV